MEEANIVLDRKSFEALAADTRVKILKSLSKRRKTLSELASELGMSVSGIKEHLETLESADLIRKIDDGHKWKYYDLTKKGDGIISPQHKGLKIMLLLSLSIVVFVASSFMLFSLTSVSPSAQPETMLASGTGSEDQANEAYDPGSESQDTLSETASEVLTQTSAQDVAESESYYEDGSEAPLQPEVRVTNDTNEKDAEAVSKVYPPQASEDGEVLDTSLQDTKSAEDEKGGRSNVPILIVASILSLGTILVCISELSRQRKKDM